MAAYPDRKRLRLLEGFLPDRGTRTELLSLPQEILSAIFRLRASDVHDIFNGCGSRRNDFLAPLCLVCTTFAELVRPIMMERVYFSRCRQVKAFTKLLAKEGDRIGAMVRHVGVDEMVRTRTKSGRSSRFEHKEVARLLALLPNITSLAITDIPVNASSVHGNLVRALTALTNLTSLVFLQRSAASTFDRRYHGKNQIKLLDVTFKWGLGCQAERILDFAESLETLVLNEWQMDDIEKLFEAPEVWKRLRSLSLLSARRRTNRIGEGQIIGLLPASLTYLALDAIHFDIPSLVNLKSSPVRIAFQYESDPFEEFGKPGEIDVVESLRILDDPRFLKLKGLEVPPEWMVEGFEMGMTIRGVSLAALQKHLSEDDDMDRAVVTFASEGLHVATIGVR